ncbi:hypothetical protein Tco_1111223 [Tanacetum coccineum]|uniref:Uncharacterized protein n=1 Tax=Tanacetum coccineum TaxID=301880 RepID=A0ABQ5IL06_9ASTR
MLYEWRLREKGADSNPYHDYRNFSTVFCLKINHGGAFTKPPKIRYKGGKVYWIDTIDFDEFSVHEEPNTELDKGLRKLATDSDVLEMLKFVSKYKVIDLYVEHSVTKEPMNIDHFVGATLTRISFIINDDK